MQQNNSETLIMTLLVRDEQDIIADNLEFHRAQGVDHFIVTDNLSVDATPEILQAYKEKGWVTVIRETDDDYNQQAWVTRMARMAASDEFGAGWVINNDADEFWTVPGSRLKDYFSGLPARVNSVQAHRHDFACLPDLQGPWHQEMIYRKTVSLNHIGKPLPPKVAHRAHANVTVLQGSHDVIGMDPGDRAEGRVEILHFPIRSQKQFENKIALGGAAYERNQVQPKTVARGWRRLYDQYRRDGDLSGYIAENAFDAAKIAAGIEDGSLKVDRQLADFFCPSDARD